MTTTTAPRATLIRRLAAIIIATAAMMIGFAVAGVCQQRPCRHRRR